MAKGDDIQKRLVDFAARIIRVTEHVPNTYAGKHIVRQMTRSGTAPAPNYAEARSAESTADFIHKLKVAHKELNETGVWMEIIVASQLLPEKLLIPLMDECDQLARILGSSIKTARKNQTT